MLMTSSARRSPGELTFSVPCQSKARSPKLLSEQKLHQYPAPFETYLERSHPQPCPGQESIEPFALSLELSRSLLHHHSVIINLYLRASTSCDLGSVLCKLLDDRISQRESKLPPRSAGADPAWKTAGWKLNELNKSSRRASLL